MRGWVGRRRRLTPSAGAPTPRVRRRARGTGGEASSWPRPLPHGVRWRWRWRRAEGWPGIFSICGLVSSLIDDILSFEQILCDFPAPNMSGVWAGFCGRSSLVADLIHRGSQAGGLDLRTCGRGPRRRADRQQDPRASSQVAGRGPQQHAG